MARTWCVWVGLLLWSGLACAAAVDLSRESLAGVHVGEPVATVKKLLGKPLKETKPQLGQATGQMESTMTWPHLTVDVGDDTVTHIHAIAPSTAGTSKGVHVGDPAANATKAYGALSLSDDKHNVALTFVVKNGRIVEIFLGYGPE